LEESSSSEATDYEMSEDIDEERVCDDCVYIALNLPYLPEDKFLSANFNTSSHKKIFI